MQTKNKREKNDGVCQQIPFFFLLKRTLNSYNQLEIKVGLFHIFEGNGVS